MFNDIPKETSNFEAKWYMYNQRRNICKQWMKKSTIHAENGWNITVFVARI